MPEPEPQIPTTSEEDSEHVHHRDGSLEVDDESWVTPPFQPIRALAALLMTAAGFGLYEYVLVSFWSVPWMGIHERTPWPAYALIASALVVALFGVRLALSLASPHAKLGFSMLAILASIAIGVGGGRFVSYTLRGTLNPPFTLRLAVGDRFPEYALADQSGIIYRGPRSEDGKPTLIYVYRGDYCPFARFELAELTARANDFQRERVNVVGVSTDPVERSRMLSSFLRTSIPLLSDARESILGQLGLVQHHRNGEPDNAIPVFIAVDQNGIVRWISTSPYYRELPRVETLLEAAKSANR
jgi:peroxiredoxin